MNKNIIRKSFISLSIFICKGVGWPMLGLFHIWIILIKWRLLFAHSVFLKFLTAMPILCHVKFNKGKNKWYFDGKTWFCTESLIITQTDNIPYNTLYNASLSNSDLNKFFFIKIILSCLKSKHWTQYCTSPKETMSFINLIWNYPLQAFRP